MEEVRKDDGMSRLRKVTTAVRTAALALLLMGCGTSARPALEFGEARWRAATGITRPMPTAVYEAFGPMQCGDLPDCTGCTNYTTDAVTIDVARPEWEVRRTGVHEWGHRLGAPEGGNGVMGAQSSTATSECITTADVDIVCAGPFGPCLWESPECR